MPASLVRFALGQKVTPKSEQPAAGPALARDILRAGQVRRAEIEITPKPTGLALQIVNAGRRARGEPAL